MKRFRSGPFWNLLVAILTYSIVYRVEETVLYALRCKSINIVRTEIECIMCNGAAVTAASWFMVVLACNGAASKKYG